MKLRFEVDQAACFRRGVNCPKSIVDIEVDPASLDQATRDLIADRLWGIRIVHDPSKGEDSPFITALGPTQDDLIAALKAAKHAASLGDGKGD